jgi:MinD superfamily P-loop ATPase
MKQLLILSGKGGTGKTTLASAFIKLSKAKAYADCDVDAPNLHLVLSQSSEPVVNDYFGLPSAKIDQEKCIKCNLCFENCRFDAIIKNANGYKIHPYLCEGCSVCEFACPVGAVSLTPSIAGVLKLYEDPDVFSTAQLRMGSGTSGKLVTEVKNQLKNKVEKEDIVIIDGSPGIGCPVIASISGVGMVLIVAEPTISGINDMGRIIKTCKNFGVLTAVCINKFDVNLTNTEKIEEYCLTNNLPYLGRIPFDSEAVKAINKGITIVDTKCAAGHSAEVVFYKTFKLLYENKG